MTGQYSNQLSTGRDAAAAETAELLSAAGAALKDMLSVLNMASVQLFPAVESLGNPQLDKYAAMISHCYFGMYRLTDNLSALAGILGGDTAPARTTYDIVGSCRALVASAAQLTGDSGCRLRFESNEESLAVSADRRLMNKLLLNLLSNSLMNTAPGGEVTVSVLSAADRVVLSVHDNGAGIRGEVLPTVWNRYGTPKAPAEKAGGIGLGMTIVQHIARLHGGSAVLESRPGEGTTVTISLPAEAPGTPCGGFELADIGDSGTQQLLAELSGVVGYDKYTQLYLD